LVTVIVKIELSLPGVNSLKEKRRIIKSLMKQARNDFNISIAEVDCNDSHRHAIMGAAIVSNNRGFCDQVVSKLMDKIDKLQEVTLIDYYTESY
jgi:uncharacterized protein YlxP (DUF503 family)